MIKKFSLANLSKMASKEIAENKDIVNNENVDLSENGTLLLDGSYLFIRAFSVGQSAQFQNLPKDKIEKQIVGMFFKTLFNEINRSSASNIIVFFDGKDTTKKRREIYPDYKMNRGGGVTSKKSFREMLKFTIELLQNELPIKTLITNGYEADDAIAYICNTILPSLNNENVQNTIVSADKDFHQLLSDNVIIYSPNNKSYVTKESFIKKHNMLPQNYIFEKIICGDNSDNVNGLYRIGKAMVNKHLTDQLHMLDNDYSEDFDAFIKSINENVTSKRMKESILAEKELLYRNYRIMSLGEDRVGENIPMKSKLYISDLVKANPLFGETVDFNVVKMLNLLKLEVNSANVTKLNNMVNKLRM